MRTKKRQACSEYSIVFYNASGGEEGGLNTGASSLKEANYEARSTLRMDPYGQAARAQVLCEDTGELIAEWALTGKGGTRKVR